jgi:hypothetical protein
LTQIKSNDNPSQIAILLRLVSTYGDVEIVYKIFIKKHEGENDTTKETCMEMYHVEMGCDLVSSVEGRVHLHAALNTVNKHKCWEFLG